MKIAHLNFSLILALGLLPFAAQMQDLHLIPSPQSVEIRSESFQVAQDLSSQSLLNVELKHPIQEQIDLIIQVSKAKGNDTSKNLLWYGTIDEDSSLKEYCRKHAIEVPKDDEGYMLYLSNDTIIVAANEKAGVLYGLYTLEQLLDNVKDTRLPEVTISDFPALAQRAIMDDISRGPLSNMSFLKSQVRRLSKLKINVLTFYIEHVVKTKNHPDFAPADGITIEEFKELSEYAEPYNVDIMGGFQSLGHFRNVLNSETYRHLGQTDRMLKPGDPEALQFLKSVYAEMIPAFSSDYFGIYADEAWDLVRMDEGLEVDSAAAAQRYINHVNPLLNFLIDRDITPIIASDMLLSFPETIDLIPKESTILSWVYDDIEDYDYWIDPFRKADLDIWICPGILNSYQIFPDYDVAFGNLEGFINSGFEKGASRVMTTVWDDGSAHFFARDWPAVAFAAAQSWKPVRNDRENFDKHFSFLMFGGEQFSLLDCISTISELKNTKAIENLGTSFLDEYLLADKGEEHFLNTSEAEEVLRIIKEGKSCLDVISRPNEKSSNEWSQDLAAWHFALDQIAQQMSNYEKLIELSDLYSEPKLAAISTELETLKDGWIETKERFSTLWLYENRKHWLDEEIKLYDKKISSLSNLKSRIDSVATAQGPLPSAAAIGIDVSPVEKESFTYWLVSERYRAKGPIDLDKDFLADLGGEKVATPTPYDWTKTQSPYAYKMDFEDVNNHSIVYLYSRIETDESIEVLPEIDFSGKCKLILNGVDLGIDRLKGDRVLLKKGKNHLILKLQLEPGIDEVRFNIKDIRTTNKKYKYKLLSE